MVPKLKSHRSGQALKKLSRSAPSHGTSKAASNKQPNKKKDRKLHMLIFEEGGFLDGTEMTYQDNEKALLKGYKAGSKIFCYHCFRIISPSEFENHAGMKCHKKPYSYIRLENGYSLHEVALYLRNMHSAVENGNSGADLLFDECRNFFHKDSASLLMNTPAKWQCGFCKKEYTEQNFYASETGSVGDVDSMIKKNECTTCAVGKNCTLAMCSGNKNCDCKFGPLALISCVQCEKEFHVRYLKEHGNSDLKAKMKGKWFCGLDCERIFLTLESFIGDGGEEKLKAFSLKNGRTTQTNIISRNFFREGVRWRLLCAKSSYNDDKLLLDATSIFYENFCRVDDDLVRSDGDLVRSDDDPIQLEDLIRDMVYGKNGENRRMYCAVLTVGSTVVAAGLFRVLGQNLAELPFAATAKDNRCQGYLRRLIYYLEELLMMLNVRSFVLPATNYSVEMWKNSFGFEEMSADQLKDYGAICWNMYYFSDAIMLHKVMAKKST